MVFSEHGKFVAICLLCLILNAWKIGLDIWTNEILIWRVKISKIQSTRDKIYIDIDWFVISHFETWRFTKKTIFKRNKICFINFISLFCISIFFERKSFEQLVILRGLIDFFVVQKWNASFNLKFKTKKIF